MRNQDDFLRMWNKAEKKRRKSPPHWLVLVNLSLGKSTLELTSQPNEHTMEGKQEVGGLLCFPLLITTNLEVGNINNLEKNRLRHSKSSSSPATHSPFYRPAPVLWGTWLRVVFRLRVSLLAFKHKFTCFVLQCNPGVETSAFRWGLKCLTWQI